jgi:hypothetical protein
MVMKPNVHFNYAVSRCSHFALGLGVLCSHLILVYWQCSHLISLFALVLVFFVNQGARDPDTKLIIDPSFEKEKATR